MQTKKRKSSPQQGKQRKLPRKSSPQRGKQRKALHDLAAARLVKIIGGQSNDPLQQGSPILGHRQQQLIQTFIERFLLKMHFFTSIHDGKESTQYK